MFTDDLRFVECIVCGEKVKRTFGRRQVTCRKRECVNKNVDFKLSKKNRKIVKKP